MIVLPKMPEIAKCNFRHFYLNKIGKVLPI